MFKKSTVEQERASLRQVESTLDRLVARKIEIENSIGATRQKIASLGDQLSATLRGVETLESLENASRASVSEKAQQEAWLTNQIAVLAALDAEIAGAKITVESIEERIYRAVHSDAMEAETAAADALWKVARGKLLEFVQAHQRSVAATNLMSDIDNRIPRAIPVFDAAWEAMGAIFLARSRSEPTSFDINPALVLDQPKIRSEKLPANERGLIRELKRLDRLDAANFLASVATARARETPAQVHAPQVFEWISHWKERLSKAESELAEAQSKTPQDYMPRGFSLSPGHRQEAKRKHEEALVGAEWRVNEARNAVENWQSKLPDNRAEDA